MLEYGDTGGFSHKTDQPFTTPGNNNINKIFLGQHDVDTVTVCNRNYLNRLLRNGM